MNRQYRHLTGILAYLCLEMAANKGLLFFTGAQRG